MHLHSYNIQEILLDKWKSSHKLQVSAETFLQY